MKKILILVLLASLMLAGCGEMVVEEVDTSDWETYEAEEFGVKLSFKYPPEAKIETNEDKLGKFRSIYFSGHETYKVHISINAITNEFLRNKMRLLGYDVDCEILDNSKAPSLEDKDLKKFGSYIEGREHVLLCYVQGSSKAEIGAGDIETIYENDTVKYESYFVSHMNRRDMQLFLKKAYTIMDSIQVEEIN